MGKFLVKGPKVCPRSLGTKPAPRVTLGSHDWWEKAHSHQSKPVGPDPPDSREEPQDHSIEKGCQMPKFPQPSDPLGPIALHWDPIEANAHWSPCAQNEGAMLKQQVPTQRRVGPS